MSDIVIYTDLSQRASAVALIESADVLIKKAEKYKEPIASDADSELLAEFLARSKKLRTDLDEERLAMTAEARKTIAKINGSFNEKIPVLDNVIERADKLIKAFLMKKREDVLNAERLATVEKARLAAAEVAAQLMLQQATTPEVKNQAEEKIAEVQYARNVVEQAVTISEAPKSIVGTYGSRTGLRDNWKWELIDTEDQPAAASAKMVPEEYLVTPIDRLDKKMLNAAAKSKKDKADIPGIRVYNDPVTASRVAP